MAKDSIMCPYCVRYESPWPCECTNFSSWAPNKKWHDEFPFDSPDDVKYPNHYCQGSIEVLDFIEANPHLGFHEANIIKYIYRYKIKGGVQDLKKAQEYLRRLIVLEEPKNEA